jgi:hypothetical protein
MTVSSDLSLNTNQLPVSLDVDPDDEDFGSILLLYLRRVANSVNTKESGLFLLQETASFEQWFQSSTPTSGSSQQNRNGYRLTMDLVALNGGPIGASATIELTSSTQPPLPYGYLYPVQGFGGALDTTGVSYFLNDPQIYVRFTASTNTIVITNNTGNDLTWCVFVMEYLKN